MTVAPIHAVAAVTEALAGPSGVGRPARAGSFEQMLLSGIDGVDQKLKNADAMVTAFALDDSVPPHRVMFALAQAQHSLGLMMQIRSHLVEAYQEIMRIQL